MYEALEERPRRSECVASAVFQYVLRTPGRFWECVEERRGRALAVYVWLAVAFEGIRDWWAKGRGAWEVDVVQRCLEKEWWPWIEGAREVLAALEEDESEVLRDARGGGLEDAIQGDPEEWIREMLELGMVGAEWR